MLVVTCSSNNETYKIDKANESLFVPTKQGELLLTSREASSHILSYAAESIYTRGV